jgi:geranylgeranyl diphosphate synthase type I
VLNLGTPLEPYVEAVEAAMRDLLRAPSAEVEPLYGAMRYHLGWADGRLQPVQAHGGKRVRPLFCLLSCQAVGGDWRAAVPLAAGIELIHNFSLIHDDIEDMSPTRRHRPTVWAQWGVAQAINTGDAMFTLGRLAVHGLTALGTPAEVVLACLRRLEETSLALCGGQYLDMAFESQAEVSLERYRQMIEGKTAALLACAAETGALVGAGLAGPHAGFRSFGLELGLAFQIVDDILGIWGDPAVTGKPAADDLRNRKKTFPILHALSALAARGEPALARLLAQPELSEDDVAAAIHWVEEAGGREEAAGLAQAHTERALAALEAAAPPSVAREALRDLALQLVERDH